MKILSLLSRRTALVLLTVLIVGSVVMVAKSRSVREKSEWRFQCKPGPWGHIECVRIAIEMPETFVSLDQIKDIHAHWYFGGQSRQQVEGFLASAGLSESQLQSVRNSKWEADVAGTWVSPSDELVLNMPAAARARIYGHLSRFPENASQYSPFVFRPELLPERLQRSELKDQTISKFKELLYSHGTLQLFADTDIFVNNLGDEHEKVRFLKTVSRTSTLLVKLKITPESNIDQLVDYWSYGGRRKDVRALLESMASVPGGATVDVAHLLPGFARQRIYSYPDPESLNVTNRHCHWTSLNFLNVVPDDRFTDETYVRETVSAAFMPVVDEPRLGDVIFFLDPQGMVIHSATYIADNIVFTKNGGAPNRPWIYMELEDLISCYMKPEEPVKTVVYRRKTI